MKKTLITLSIFLSVLTGFAQQTIELNNWKFKTGDNIEWAKHGFDDSQWQPIEVGKGWEIQGHKGYDGYAWYRVKFRLPSELKKKAFLKDSLQLFLGEIDDCDQAFLNGQLIGANGKAIPAAKAGIIPEVPEKETWFYVGRNYVLAANNPCLKWNKENVLAIRVFDGGGSGGMFSTDLDVRMKDVACYAVPNISSPILEVGPGGMVNKTIVLENQSPLPELKGTLTMALSNANSRQLIATQTLDVDLKKEAAFTFNLQGDVRQRMRATYTFTESKSGSKATYTQETECAGGWAKYEKNPVLGGSLGAMFDISVLRGENGGFLMYSSWRMQKSIGLSESADGLNWSTPVICMPFNNQSGWEDDVNRPVVIKKDGIYHLWYTGQTGAATDQGHSWIGYATSTDGKYWVRPSDKPVLSAELPWEHVAVMCPHVIWDEQEQLYKMWYCGGEQVEPDAIGYATSKDGIRWEKYQGNPIFTADRKNHWEQERVGGPMVIKRRNDYLMFYIGYVNRGYAQIGMARSKDGITNWERYSENPILKPGLGWDLWANYKPYVVPDPANNRWLLWYNGSGPGSFAQEQIGVAIHEGMDLGF